MCSTPSTTPASICLRVQPSVATSTLQVSATPGTYTLGVIEAAGFTAEDEELELATAARS